MAKLIIVDSRSLERTFDEAAILYDANGAFAEHGERLVDLLEPKPEANVLDVAVGGGAVLLPAARRVGGDGHVTGIDISKKMLVRTGQKAAEMGLTNVTLMKMDGGILRFPNASFDVVTCGFGVFFLPATALDEMYRVCKPGGKIGVTVFDKAANQDGGPGEALGRLVQECGIEIKYTMPLPARFTPDEIGSLIASSGFTDVKTIRRVTDTVFGDLEDYWVSILSGGNRALLSAMDAPTRKQFKAELFRRLASFTKPDGLHLPFAAIFVTGLK